LAETMRLALCHAALLSRVTTVEYLAFNCLSSSSG